MVDLLLTRTQHSAQSHSSDRVRSHQALAILEAINHLGRVVADAILRDGHLLAEKLLEARCRRAQRELVLGAVLGTAKVGRDGYTGTVVKKVPRMLRLTLVLKSQPTEHLRSGLCTSSPGSRVRALLDSRDRRADASVVGDGLAIQRHVEVAADQHLFAASPTAALALKTQRQNTGRRF